MHLTLRLYYPADADLIAVRIRLGRKFNTMVRQTLDSYLSEKVPIFDMPENISKFVHPISHPILINIELKNGRDDKIINFLQGVKPSGRISLVKTLIRASYSSFPVSLLIGSYSSTESRISQPEAILSNQKKEITSHKDTNKKQTVTSSGITLKEENEEARPSSKDEVIKNSTAVQIKITQNDSSDKEVIPTVKAVSKDSTDDDGDIFEMFSKLI